MGRMGGNLGGMGSQANAGMAGMYDPARGNLAGAFPDVTKAMKELAKTMKDLDDGADKAKKSATDFAGELAGMSAGFGRATAVMATGLNQLNQLLGSIGSQIGQYVALYNPAAFERFRLAADDARAAIGQALLPVMEKMTVLTRAIGDGIASLSPAAKAMVAGLAAGTVAMGALAGAAAAFSYAVSAGTFGLSAVVGAVVGGLAGLSFQLKGLSEVQAVVNKVMGVATQAFNVFGAAAVRVAQAAMPILDAVLGAVGQLVRGLMPGVMRFADAFTSILSELAPVLAQTVPAMVQLVGAVLKVARRSTGRSWRWSPPGCGPCPRS